MTELTKTIVVAIIAGAAGAFFFSTLTGASFGASPAANLTRVSNPWTFSNTVTMSGTVAITGSSSHATTTVGTFEQGGNALSTSTVTTSFGALSELQLSNNSVLTFTPNVSSATTTLPAASTLTTLINATGDTRSWTFINGTSTASIRVGIAAGSGVDLDANVLNFVQIAPNASARVTCVTVVAATTVRCQVDNFAVGD